MYHMEDKSTFVHFLEVSDNFLSKLGDPIKTRIVEKVS
jgi:hypothetical protein